jgi:hypothetical protein
VGSLRICWLPIMCWCLLLPSEDACVLQSCAAPTCGSMLLPHLLPTCGHTPPPLPSPDLALRHGHSACLPSRASMKVERQSSTRDRASTSSITGMPPCSTGRCCCFVIFSNKTVWPMHFGSGGGRSEVAAAVGGWRAVRRRRRWRDCDAHPLPGELDHYSHRRCAGRACD